MPTQMNAQHTAQPVAVLLHSSASSQSQWRDLRNLLADDFDVLTPEQWNCGNAPAWPGTKPFTLIDEAQRVADEIAHVREPVHLVGHSYGAGVALRLARAWPERVASLTLIEPTPFHLLRHRREDRPLYDQINLVAQQITRDLVSGHVDSGMRRFVDFWTAKGSWDRMPEDRRIQLMPRLSKVPLDFLALFQDEAKATDFRDVTAPALIIQGENSRRQVARICDLLSTNLNLAGRKSIAGAGHMAPVTHAPLVNSIIRDFLDSQVPRQRRAA